MVSMAWLGEALKTLNRPMHERVGPFGTALVESGEMKRENCSPWPGLIRRLSLLSQEPPAQEVGARESVTNPLH